jgi:hypothetical protein
MSFKSPSVPVLGKRSGKQNGPRFGIPGSMVGLPSFAFGCFPPAFGLSRRGRRSKISPKGPFLTP